MDHLLLGSRDLECSATKVAHVVSQSIFDVARLMQATLQQCLDSSLALGTLNRGETCVPLGCNFCVGRQACNIDEILRLNDGLFVERSNAYGQRLDESIEFRVRQSAIDVAITLSKIARN